MFCPNCGSPIGENNRFCPNCGENLETFQEVQPVYDSVKPEDLRFPEPDPPRGITLCSDGVYRWYYEFNMLKNPVILLTVLKIFAIIIGIGYLIMDIAAIADSGFSGLSEVLVGELIFAAFWAALCAVSYLILAATYGWKYMVLFEMDDKGFLHIQQPKQFKKAQAMGWLTALAGVATGNVTMAGQGILAGSKMTSATSFEHVKSIKVMRRYNTIKVNEPFSKNQIYTEPGDFEFVLDYISQRIPDKAKRK